MKSYMCKLRVGSFITQYSLLPLCNVCGNKKVLFGNLNRGNRAFNLYKWNGECFTDVIFSYFLRATRGARNPNLQVVVTHASHLCSQHSFGLTKNEWMHRTQFDHARLDLLSLVIWSRVVWPSVTWNYAKHIVGAKAFWPSIVVGRTP